MLDVAHMGKLNCIALVVGLALGACVTEADTGAPPQPTDGQDETEAPGDEGVPLDPTDGVELPDGCASFDSKSDSPCTTP